MKRFEYLVRRDLHGAAEDASRSFGGKERQRLAAYTSFIAAELNKLGAEGWELIQAPDNLSNFNWIFKRPLA